MRGGIEGQPEAGGQTVWTVTDSMMEKLGPMMEAQEMLEVDVLVLQLVDPHWS